MTAAGRLGRLGRRALAIALAGGLALGAAACKRQEEPGPAARAPVMGAAEIARAKDACRTYVDQVCACAETVPAARRQCELARALPDSIDLTTDVSAHPETERKDVTQSAAAIRKIVARCIEETAKLPELGCAAPGPRR